MKITNDVICFYSEKSNSFTEQLDFLFKELNNYLQGYSRDYRHVLKMTFFINASNNDEYEQIENQILNYLKPKNKINFVPISIIAQAPLNGSDMALEAILAKDDQSCNIYKESENTKYVIVSNPSGDYIYVSGIRSHQLSSISENATYCFMKLESILKSEGYSFSDIIRQWNFIEDITDIDDVSGKHLQHYQVFNDIRSKYYSESRFSNGYPAATGIGTRSGGICIECIAMKPNPNISILPVKNPLQIDAHSYSESVLLGESLVSNTKTSPKFERAKLIEFTKSIEIHVSGTAAIIGEKTISDNKADKQTLITLENIFTLVSVDNLQAHGIMNDLNQNKTEYLRVYIKNRQDFSAVREIVEQIVKCENVLYVEAGVCRNDLLVEIEGIFSYQKVK